MLKEEILTILDEQADKLKDSSNPLIQLYINGFQTAIIILKHKIKEL